MFVLSLIRVRVLLVLLCGVQCSLHGMLDVENNKQVLWDVIVANSLSRGDYETYRNVAVLNKAYSKFIDDLYKPHKKRIEGVMQEKNIVLEPWRISWNRDFSRCTWVEKPIEHYSKYWILVLMGLHNNEVVIKPYAIPEGSAPVFYKYPRSYFTKDGQAFCHLYAYRTEFSKITYTSSVGRNIVQSKYDFSGHVGGIVCVIGMEDHFAPWMVQMLNYPYCIRDFLRSTDVSIIDHPAYGCVKSYHIRGVTVSDCYKGFEKYSHGGGIDYSGYSVLPEDFRNSMDDLFFKQQAEKQNQNSQEK